MANQHPITPTLELMREWAQWNRGDTDPEDLWLRLCTRAAQWGADQELEACRMEIIDGAGRVYINETSDRVRLADDIWSDRRPKPPSLKSRALQLLDLIQHKGQAWNSGDMDTIRLALEALPDD